MLCANETYAANKAALEGASAGIVSPEKIVLERGTLLFRYGNDWTNVTCGPWWLDLAQQVRVREWAVLGGLALPHAIRVACAIMHEWHNDDPAAKVARSTMEYCVRATTTRPLWAFRGATLPQQRRVDGKIVASIKAPPLDPPITQLFIPGLWDAALCRDVLNYDSVVHVGAGASALFGGDAAILSVH
jgi:hypothetical protein